MREPYHVYEQPLNERIRGFLRLEFLFERAAYRADGANTWDSRATLEAVIDILALLGRSDLKTEIMKELDRQACALDALQENPGVDTARLREILDRIKGIQNRLRAQEGQPGHELRQHELIGQVRQRNSIPAGSCGFDVPAYQYWLERPSQERLDQLHAWLHYFDPMRDALGLCLSLIRESASGSLETAGDGFYQRNLDANSSCQMVRILVPENCSCFPEISGGRHRFSVRFMRQDDIETRPIQVQEDIHFELQCCVI